MAFEIENELVAGVAWILGVAVAQTGILSVTNPSTGVVRVVTVESLGDHEDCTTCLLVASVANGGIINVSKIAPNEWEIRTYRGTDRVALDKQFWFKVFRIATGN